ncbi:peptidase C13 family-domain-containing protein [Cyathus striatus]|nr:peptidase C13 family-domain-containing protein [Cyathus striatus]
MFLFPFLCFFTWFLGVFSQEHVISDFYSKNGTTSISGHTNNWAVLVCTSRYWFNYRHMANTLGMYRTVKRLGIPDSNIILMLADDSSCNLRNKFPGSVYANPGRQLDLYGDNVEVDYRGYEVTVENFIRALTGRVDPSIPRSKRLLTDERSNIFVYLSGHGGNEFLKFQDNEEISATDIADAIEQMYQKKRYNEVFFMIDTCQANTMYSKFYSPNILATGSSKLNENSYSVSHGIDAYTHYVLEFMEGINKTSHKTMQDLVIISVSLQDSLVTYHSQFDSYDVQKIGSHPGIRSDLFRRPLANTLITDFLGGVAQAEVVPVLHDYNAPVEKVQDAYENESAAQVKVSPVLQVRERRPILEQPRNEWKTLKAWGSVVVIGCLVGWVSSRR